MGGCVSVYLFICVLWNHGANFRGLLNIYVLIIRIYVEKFKINFKEKFST